MSRKFNIAVVCCGNELAELREYEFWYGGKGAPRFWIRRKRCMLQRRAMEVMTDEQAHDLYRRRALPNLIRIAGMM